MQKGADNSKMKKTEYLKAPAGMRNPSAEDRKVSDILKALEADKVSTMAQCNNACAFCVLKEGKK